MTVFITLEGGEGAGKSSQAKDVVERLRKEGIDVIHTREPGGCPQAEDLRNLLVTGDGDRWTPVSEILLFTAARLEHLTRTIRPALDRGAVVICDRYVDSTLAYQGAGGGASHDLILSSHKDFCDNQMPDMTIVLDIDPKIGLLRSGKRLGDAHSNEDRFEGLDISFHEKVRVSLLNTSHHPERHAVVVDASKDYASISEEIYLLVKQAIKNGPRHSGQYEFVSGENRGHPDDYHVVKNGVPCGEITKTMNDGFWSVQVNRVKWELPKGDPRRLVYTNGLIDICYIEGLQEAMDQAVTALENRDKKKNCTIYPLPARLEG